MKNSKDKGACFKLKVIDEAIMDVQKQVHIQTPLERALTDKLNVQ